MALSKAEDVRKLSNEDLQAEILQSKQKLFQLRFQQTVGQTEKVKPHEFRNTKRWIAQLLTVQTEREKGIRTNSQNTTIVEE